MEVLMKKKQLNREISWMYFNHRVLQEAAKKSVPLIERLRFLGIYANNLDEFYRVRVAMLRRLARIEKDDREGAEADRILVLIGQIAAKQQSEFDLLYEEIIEELHLKKIRLLDQKQLDLKQLHDTYLRYIYAFYHTQLMHSINPLIVDDKQKLPELTDASTYMIVCMKNDKATVHYALIELPTNEFSRFIVLPPTAGVQRLVLLEDVIRICLPLIFSCLDYHKFTAYCFKLTRDAEMDLEQDIDGGLLDKIMRGVKKRKKGWPVRLEYQEGTPKQVVKYILNHLQFDKQDTIISPKKHLNFKDFMRFPDFNKPSLLYPNWGSVRIKALDEAPNMFEYVKTADLALHYPYHSFSYFIRFIREAAIDPKVKSIKISLYRLAKESKVIQALIAAANNGKKVSVVIELLARFDESANVHWSTKLQDAGVKVIFGIENLKVHSKIVHISRKGGDLACVCTGNFHEGNAKIYTDVALFTADARICSEIDLVFDFIQHPYNTPTFHHLLVSPQMMRKKLYTFIRREEAWAKAGKPAYLLCKINHITDPELINRLYKAAQQGVKIDLIVRGNCSVRPVHSNIRVISIVDRYLEHSRIFIFGNGGEEECFIGSADWMTRNLDHRVEVACPVYAPLIKKMFKQIIELGLADNTNARIVDGSGENVFVTTQGKKCRSQKEMLALMTKIE